MSQAKQRFLDSNPSTTEDFTIQQMLVLLTKTEVAQFRRNMDKLIAVLYKTHWKEQPLTTIHQCLRAAEILNKDETNEQQSSMENT